MSEAARLLKMLEPAVRPVDAAGAAKPVGELPFEQRPFDDLLNEATASAKVEAPESNPSSDSGTPVAEVQGAAGPLSLLSDLGRVENAGLRDLIAQSPLDRAASADPSEPTATPDAA